jgi:hypothetical protein
MRNLSREEAEFIDNLAEDGFVPIEATMEELAEKGTELAQGELGNQPFALLVEKFPGRKVCGYYNWFDNSLMGIIHIECSEKEVSKIERIAENANTTLRENGPSLKDNFWEFENE